MCQGQNPWIAGGEKSSGHYNINHHFIIPSSQCTPDIPVGCWTHVSFTYDMQHDCQVYLKDSWCVLLEGIKLEGEIYCLLHAKKVPNIPSYLSAGDVSNKAYHWSRTDEIVNNQNFELCDHRSHWKLTPHWHYHIVLPTIGRKLEDFKCTQEFVQAMYAALRGKMTIS